MSVDDRGGWIVRVASRWHQDGVISAACCVISEWSACENASHVRELEWEFSSNEGTLNDSVLNSLLGSMIEKLHGMEQRNEKNKIKFEYLLTCGKIEKVQKCAQLIISKTV